MKTANKNTEKTMQPNVKVGTALQIGTVTAIVTDGVMVSMGGREVKVSFTAIEKDAWI